MAGRESINLIGCAYSDQQHGGLALRAGWGGVTLGCGLAVLFLNAVGLLAEFPQRVLDAAFGEDAEVADAVKAARQDMAEVSSDEFVSRQSHRAIAGLGLPFANGFAVSE